MPTSSMTVADRRTRRFGRSNITDAMMLSLLTLMAMVSAVGGSVDVVLSEPQPLAQAARQFARNFGLRITYEDPEYHYSGDLRDATGAIAQAGKVPDGKKVLVPDGGTLNFSYISDDDSNRPVNTVDALKGLIAAQATLNQGGQFQLREAAGYLHIIPVRVRDVAGDWRSVVPLLDQRISFPAKKRTAAEFLDAFCSELTKVRGARVGVASLPMNMFATTTMESGARNEVAREVLLTALQKVDARLVWRLYHVPANDWMALNIDVATDKAKDIRPRRLPPPPIDIRSAKPPVENPRGSP